MAGVVGGVECSDGEEQCACSAAVWLCVTLMQTRVWCLCAVGRHCASACVCERTLGGRTVAGVVGGVESSDGEEQRMCNAAVPLCGCVCNADADVCVVFVCSGATLRFWLRVREDNWRSHSGWCRRRGRMQRRRGTMYVTVPLCGCV